MYRDFPKRLASAMKSKGFTDSSLALLIGKSHTLVNSWRLGKAVPSYDNIEKLSIRLGVSETWLFGGESKIGDDLLIGLKIQLDKCRDGYIELRKRERKLENDLFREAMYVAKLEATILELTGKLPERNDHER